MRKGAKHGSGVFLTKEGHRIEGQWKEGHACGEMSAQYTNGDFYKGGIVRYLRHGHGCLTSVATGIKVRILGFLFFLLCVTELLNNSF